MDITGSEVRQLRQQCGLSQAKLAALSAVPQHLLSSFELGKSDLPLPLRDAVLLVLADSTKVTEAVKRNKRYQEHKYLPAQKLADRVARAVRTSGNSEYVELLNEIGVRHNQKNNDSISALSLFSGCGGFSLGFSAAGFSVKGFLELEESLKEIYKKNFSDTLELGGDITRITEKQLFQLFERIGAVDVIFGGPPCQGFSLSGKRQIDDPRNSLFRHYLRFVDVFKPKIAVLENVRLLTSMKNSSGMLVKDEICQDFISHGYKIQYFEINVKDYGVPQHRERILFVAVRGDLELQPTLPQPTHSGQLDLFSTTKPYRTFADACSDLPFVESGEQSDDPLHESVMHPSHVIEWLWDVPEGRSAHDNESSSKRPPSGYNTTYKRQIWNEPAATVQTNSGMISGCRNVHPIATRSLTIREAARIQSFPDSYHFMGGSGTIRKGIGNAVPPLLAYQIALHVRKILLDFIEVS